ncbi:hypothetical protein Tco_0821132 [Tanacetum coccineum]|uniref:Uncharacterized protein n=1 Tax=Tanacetum coccineum TaxID=301880 RepID=A0ABQ5ACD1_9ASTR
MPRNQLALTRPRLSDLIAITHGTLLESADQKEIKKAEEEMQGTLDIKQNTIGGDLENRRNLNLCQMSTRDKSGLGYGNQIHEGVLSYEKEVLESVFDSRSSDVEDSPVNDRFANVEGMHAVPPPMTGNYMPPKSDLGIDDVETLESVTEPVLVKPKVVSQPKVWSDAPIIEEYESDSDDEYVIKPSKEQEKPSFAFVNTTTGSEMKMCRWRMYMSTGPMIGSLMYLTASRPDIMFVVCAGARFQVTPKASYLNAVKRIFRYLKHQPKLGLWYPKDSPFKLEAYSDSDYEEASLDRKSTTGGCQFLGRRTKHIEIRFHFIRDCYEKRLIEVVKIHTDNNVADLLTRGFDVTRFNFLVVSIGMKNMDLKMDGRCADNLSLIWLYALTHNPPIYDSLVKQFLQTATVRTLADGTQQLIASINNKDYTIIEAFVRSKLKLADATGISNLSDAEIYEGLGTLGSKSGRWDQFGIPIATALICLSNNRVYNFSKLIFDGMGPTPTIVADEATTTGVGVDTEGATTTTSSLDAGLDSGNIHESPLRSHETTPQEGHTSRSVEDRLKLQELMVLVPKLKSKIDSLEKELKDTKQTFRNAILTLVDRVKLLKDFVTPTKSKVSASGEAQEEDISPTTLEATKTLTRVGSLKAKSIDKGRRYKRRKISKGKDINTGLDDEADINAGNEDINTGNEDINTGFEEVNTGSIGVSTGSGPVSTSSTKVSIPSLIRSQREGKAPMITGETQATKRTKEQIQQEEASLAKAIRLQTLEEEETAKQHVIRAKLEANAKLTKSVLGKDLPEEDFAKRMVDLVNQRKKYFAKERAKAKRSKPMTQSQLRTYMTNYLKNQGTWKLTQLKKLSFDEIKEEFDKLVKQIDTFVPMGFEATKAKLKRYGEELQTRIPKKQKIDDKDVQPTEEKVTEVKEEEPVKRIGKRKKLKARKRVNVDKTMLDKKLQGDKKNEACYKLLKLIEKQARIKWSGL